MHSLSLFLHLYQEDHEKMAQGMITCRPLLCFLEAEECVRNVTQASSIGCPGFRSESSSLPTMGSGKTMEKTTRSRRLTSNQVSYLKLGELTK